MLSTSTKGNDHITGPYVEEMSPLVNEANQGRPCRSILSRPVGGKEENDNDYNGEAEGDERLDHSKDGELEEQVPTPISTFTYFPQLSTELRLMVWHFAIEAQDIMAFKLAHGGVEDVITCLHMMTRPSTLLQTDKEPRTEYTRLNPGVLQHANLPALPVNFNATATVWMSGTYRGGASLISFIDTTSIAEQLAPFQCIAIEARLLASRNSSERNAWIKMLTQEETSNITNVTKILLIEHEVSEVQAEWDTRISAKGA